MKRFSQVEKGQKHSPTEGQHQERQKDISIQTVCRGTGVKGDLVWMEPRWCWEEEVELNGRARWGQAVEGFGCPNCGLELCTPGKRRNLGVCLFCLLVWLKQKDETITYMFPQHSIAFIYIFFKYKSNNRDVSRITVIISCMCTVLSVMNALTPSIVTTVTVGSVLLSLFSFHRGGNRSTDAN